MHVQGTRSNPLESAVGLMNISRRNFLVSLGLAAVSSGLLASSDATTEALDLVWQRIALPHLPKAFEGYRIAFITDLHLGPCVDPDLARRAVDLVNNQDPHLIILGGDYILRADSFTEQFAFSCARGQSCMQPYPSYSEEQQRAAVYFSEIAQILSPLTAPDGVIGVLGNHDYWVSPAACHLHLSPHVRLLTNELHTVKRGTSALQIYGADDYWSGRPKAPAFADETSGSRILLTHNPDYVSELVSGHACNFDLALCGHTHGGQIRLPSLRAPFYNVSDISLADGLAQAGTAVCYTSRGIGTVGFPVRINCPPEATIFELAAA